MCQALTKSGDQCSRKVEPFCVQHARLGMWARNDPNVFGRNRVAVEATITALTVSAEFDGAVRAVDAARVEMARSLADACDLVPGNAQLWRQYSDAVKGLVSVDVSASPADELTKLLRSTVGDASSP